MPSRPGTAGQLLRARGAGTRAHPGGTLLDHLGRVRAQLAAWGAPEEVQVAGLCHAAYGTDGYREALIAPSERQTLTAAIGAEAEALVYLYGSCDRDAVYPQLDHDSVEFLDRSPVSASSPRPRRCGRL